MIDLQWDASWNIYCILYHTSYNHDNMDKTADSRSAEHVPDCSLAVCLVYLAHGISTVDYLTVCFPMIIINTELLWITSVWSAFSCWILALSLWIISLRSCILLMDSLCHDLSTVNYLAAVCFLLMNSLSAMNYQLWITLLRSAFSWWIHSLP